MNKRIVMMLGASMLVAGCATVVRGAKEQIQFNSDPPGAQAQTSLGFTCVTPCFLQVSRSDDMSVIFSKPGYRREQVLIHKRLHGEGVAAFAGNAILGGVVGVGVDAVTNAAWDHCPNPVTVKLQRIADGANVAMKVDDPCPPVTGNQTEPPPASPNS